MPQDGFSLLRLQSWLIRDGRIAFRRNHFTGSRLQAPAPHRWAPCLSRSARTPPGSRAGHDADESLRWSCSRQLTESSRCERKPRGARRPSGHYLTQRLGPVVTHRRPIALVHRLSRGPNVSLAVQDAQQDRLASGVLFLLGTSNDVLELGWLATSQGGRPAIGIKAHPIRPSRCGITIEKRLSCQHSRERISISSHALCCIERRIGSNVRKLASVEDEPKKSADSSEVSQSTFDVRTTVDHNQIVGRNDKGKLATDACGVEGAIPRLTAGATPLLIGPVHHR